MSDEKKESFEKYMRQVGNEFIPAYEPLLGDKEKELLADVVDGGWLSEHKYTREFESRLATFCEREYAVAFCNATSALIAGMKSLGIGSGDEVVVPSFTHPADPNAISACGATPVFADVDEKTLCLSPATIEKVRTAKTKAVLLVSLYGNTPDLDAIQDYVSDKGLFLVHDCAAALGTKFKGKPATTYGNFSVLSFYADKTITTGEGGMLLTDDADLIAEVNMFKHDGRKERGVDVVDRMGFNFRITELQSAVGVAQLDQLDSFIVRKKQVFVSYLERIPHDSGVKVFTFNPDSVVVPHRVVVFVSDAKPLVDFFVSKGVGARSVFMPMHSQPCYNVKGGFPVTEKLYKTGVCLPSAPSLTEDNIIFVCDAVREFYK